MFAKIFAQIFESSIADDWQLRIVFQDLLVLADKDGVVDMTPAAIARRTNVPLEIVLDRLKKLEDPDPSSRTPDHEGRRIVRLDNHRDWGWRIVNFSKYRESATKEMLRMAEAERKRVYRNRQLRIPSPTPPTLKTQNQKQRGEAEMSTDMSGTSNPNPPQRKRPEWQLLKDENALTERIQKEAASTNPDRELIKALKDKRSALRSEMKA